MAIGIKDRYLVERSFRIMCGGATNASMQAIMNKDMYYNFFSSAPGDNRYVNPLPGFSPACDPRPTQFLADALGGMGTQYKRIYDDNASLVTFTVGVPEFTGLLPFILNMFDPVAAIMANKGRAPGISFFAGQALGTIAFYPLQVMSIGVQFLTYLTQIPQNQFYYVKPAMGAYLQSATGLLNDIMVAQGFVKPILPISGNDVALLNGIGKENSQNYQAQIDRLSKLFPDVVNSDGTIDLMRLVSRGTRKYRYMLTSLKELDNRAINSPEEKYDAMESRIAGLSTDALAAEAAGMRTASYIAEEYKTVAKLRNGSSGGDTSMDDTDEGNYPEQASSWLRQDVYNNVQVTDNVQLIGEDGASLDSNSTRSMNTSNVNYNGSGNGDSGGLDTNGQYTQATPGAASGPQPASQSTADKPRPPQATQINYQDNKQDESWLGSIGDLLQTAFAGGFDAVTFRCEHLGEVSDSFSSSFAPSPLAGKFNAMTRGVNDLKFDMAGGNIGIPIVDGVLNMAKDFVTGVASSMHIANIPMAIANNSYLNVPEHWADASANLHRESYRFTFEALYGTPYSQITNLWIYYALLAPLFMPNSAGGSMYTSPFMIKLFAKSRQIMRCCMVESATIRFGEGVGGWTRDRKPLKMVIELNFVDMEKFVAVPISRVSGVAEAITNPAAGIRKLLLDSGKYNEYITRLAGQDYLDTVLRWNDLSKRLTTAVVDFKRTFSSSNVAANIGDSIVGDIGRLFTRQISR